MIFGLVLTCKVFVFIISSPDEPVFVLLMVFIWPDAFLKMCSGSDYGEKLHITL